MIKKKTQKEKLDSIREWFKYDHNGNPDIYSYGIFKTGLTREELENYLRVRSGKWNIKTIKKQFNKIAGCNTMASVTLTGDIFTVDGTEKETVHILLNYRHDIERFADQLFEGRKTYFD